jgi:hypothetical protein
MNSVNDEYPPHVCDRGKWQDDRADDPPGANRWAAPLEPIDETSQHASGEKSGEAADYEPEEENDSKSQASPASSLLLSAHASECIVCALGRR